MISWWSCSLALFFTVALPALTVCQNEDIKKVLVDVEVLPEPFTNSKLPFNSLVASLPDYEKCYSLMGCFEAVPTFFHPDPMTIKTVFIITHKDTQSVIQVEECENCLEKDPGQCDEYPFDLQKLKDSSFRPDRRTIIIIGGYRSNATVNWEQDVRNLWSKLDDVNVILVDWGAYNHDFYPQAVANTRPVARQLTVLLYYLAKLKVNSDLNDDAYLDRFYLIGHSLGAHIVGFTGSDLAGRLGRITGLDPAGPMFDSLDRRFRIDRSDARFVDILHTNAGGSAIRIKPKFGSALSSGHIDLWANNGQYQPGCSENFSACSHRRATKYYIEYLKDALAMREYMGDKKYRPMYRLRAYWGDDFEDFHGGSSLVRRCPKTAHDGNDSPYDDSDHCSIPIDYVSWYNDFKGELEAVHGLNFNSFPNNFYFYTSEMGDEQLDHYVMTIRVSEQINGQAAGSTTADNKDGSPNNGYSVGVDIEMAGKHEMAKHKLYDVGDHYEIVFPFLASNSIVKYDIAELDSNDFYIERSSDNKEILSPKNLALLRVAIGRVFPPSITLRSPNITDASRQSSGFFNAIKNFLKRKLSRDGENKNELQFGSIIVKPLRKFHRHVLALYSPDCSGDDQSDFKSFKVTLVDDNGSSHKDNPSKGAIMMDDCTGYFEVDKTKKLSMKEVIVGSRMVFELEEGEAGTLKTSELWLILTVLLLLIVLTIIFSLVLTMRSKNNNDMILDKQSPRKTILNVTYSQKSINNV